MGFSKGGGFAVDGFTDETRRGGEGFRDAVEIEDEDEEDERGGDSDEEKVCEDEVFNGGAFAGFTVFRRGGGGEEGAAVGGERHWSDWISVVS
ncbi:hypothetical protein Tco_0393936 [Tanacetum coccineum]